MPKELRGKTMNVKTDTSQFLKYAIAIRGFFLVAFGAGFAITSGDFILPLVVYAVYEICIWFAYFYYKRINKIIAISLMGYTFLSPEVMTISAIYIFCYGGIWRSEVWFSIIALVVGYLYAHVIFNDTDFNTQKLARHLTKGEYDGASPTWSELDWFGKIFLYVTYVPTFAAVMMFGVAMWADDLPKAAQHKYIMAGGYAMTFFAMNLTAARIWFKRVKRTVKEHNLNWT